MRRSRFALLGGVGAALLMATIAVSAGGDSQTTVDRNATITSGGTAVIVTGTIICDEGTTENVSALVQQRQGKIEVAGQGDSDIGCTGTAQTFSIVVQEVLPAFGTFKKGPADALIGSGGDAIITPIHISQ